MPTFLESIEITMNKMMAETWLVKAVLVSSQTEPRKILLNNGEKLSCAVKWQGAWLNCVLVFVEGRTCT